jgi:hypothetical protein
MKTVLKPGILVSLKTALRGNIHYDRHDLTPDYSDQNGAEACEKWETVKTIADVREHEAATTARNFASTTIRRQCQPTAFGLLCPVSNEDALDSAVREARATVDAFNDTARQTSVEVYVIKGRIAETDEEATRALVSEVKSLLDDMETGIRDLDPEKIRKAATEAKQVSAMMAPEQETAVGEAIDAARSAARAIVKRVEKGGEKAERVLMSISMRPIDEARFAFLDLGGDLDTGTATLPSVDASRFDLDDDDQEPEVTPTVDDTRPDPEPEVIAMAPTPSLFDMEV